MTFVFRKYFDDEKVASTLRFNSVRIMSNNGESLIRNYSFNVELQIIKHTSNLEKMSHNKRKIIDKNIAYLKSYNKVVIKIT